MFGEGGEAARSGYFVIHYEAVWYLPTRLSGLRGSPSDRLRGNPLMGKPMHKCVFMRSLVKYKSMDKIDVSVVTGMAIEPRLNWPYEIISVIVLAVIWMR